MKSILFAASEGMPFIKSGGLADVIGSLPKELIRQGCDVRVVLPLYLPIVKKQRDTFVKSATFDVHYGKMSCPCTVYEKTVQAVRYYFIEHANYFERESMYGYADDGERFSFFQIAIVEMLKHIDYFPDIIHSNDWHTGMIPFLCRVKYGVDPRYQQIKHIFMIHNIAYQGYFSKEILESCLGASMEYYNNGSLRLHDGISFMKAGIVFCDKIMTVSPTYAKEILTPQYGEKLETALKFRSHDLIGIVNGIDTEWWNPATDKHLFSLYDASTFKKGKASNKVKLQKELGLRPSEDVMLIGMVSRLTWQKGANLITERLAEIMGLDIQLAILGTGEVEMENQLKQMETKYHRRAAYYCGYNEELAHRIYAGCDLFLMPSLFEPCGISQLIAMRYGALPLVRETGGLKDTVIPYNEFTGEGTGFSFALFSGYDMFHVLKYSTDIFYEHRKAWNSIVKAAMAKDVGWNKSAREYITLYETL